MVLALLTSCSAGIEAPLEPLVGRWTTADPLYAGRSFEITAAETLVIGVGDGEEQRCAIVGLEAQARDTDRTEYTLVYRDVDGGRSTFELEHSRARQTLRMRSRPSIDWRRQEAP